MTLMGHVMAKAQLNFYRVCGCDRLRLSAWVRTCAARDVATVFALYCAGGIPIMLCAGGTAYMYYDECAGGIVYVYGCVLAVLGICTWNGDIIL